ncbi:MAG TPA: YdiU family protein [Pirellulaceae bacterium]|nr:YdiU family protein [Pirellulaceae bacterium]
MTLPALHHSLETLAWDNRFTRELPADLETANYCRQVKAACYSRVLPQQVVRPQLVAYAQEVAALLDLAPQAIATAAFAQVFAGNRVLPGMDPFAMCYGGHQFGNWAGQLGDGRAINLGEVVNARQQHWMLQLKGAGPTPYSRQADGFAVLRSSVREFLCSEAMFHLGVPTTRALSLVLTGEQVLRDMFYDGRPSREPGAVVCRVAPSFTRFGNFQILAARSDVTTLKQLADHTIRADFPHLGEPSPSVYAQWFEEVCERTAVMVAHWLRVGFVHGVMNTDNMSILGLTIDYGPYGWLENFDPGWTPNTTDAAGKRYRYGQQPQVAYWNLAQLATALTGLVDDAEQLGPGLDRYAATFTETWQTMLARKLGFERYEPATDAALTGELLALLPLVETDMTIFFRQLALVESDPATNLSDEALLAPLQAAYYVPAQLTPEYIARAARWLRDCQTRWQHDGTPGELRRARMDAVNPKYVLRNYLAQLAIDKAEQGDFSLIGELLEVLRHPYDEQPTKTAFAELRPDWARDRPGCSMLSCSS